MKVYLNEYIHPDAVALLASRAEIVTSFDHIEEIDGILSRGTPVTAEMIAKAKKLKVVGKHGVGFNKIDVKAAQKAGVTVVYTPLANMNSVAELTVALVLDAARKVSLAGRSILADKIKRIAPPEMTGFELDGKTLGLVGMGNIARRVAKILHGGFDMNVIGYDPYVSAEQAEQAGIRKYESIEMMLENADVVTIHVPLNDGTRGLIGAAELEHCRQNGILVNTSRGGIVDEHALYEALASKKLFAAASDVFAEEPPSSVTALMKLDNFVGTPHIGACTEEAMQRVGKTVVEDIIRVIEGEEPLFPVRQI